MARPPQPQGGGSSVRAAPDPVTQFLDNVKGATAARAHEGLQNIRQAASQPYDISDAFAPFGMSPRNLKEIGGAIQTLTSPAGGLGWATGHNMWPNPGDPRAGRMGDLAQAAVPLPPAEKLLEGTNAAARLTGDAANGLMRSYFARRTAQMAEEAATPAYAPLSRASSPSVASTVTPHQQAAAAWEKLGDLRQRGAPPQEIMDANNAAVTQSRQLGVPISGTVQDMVGAHLEPDKPHPYDPNNDPTRDADLEEELDDRAGDALHYEREGWDMSGEPEPAWDYTGGRGR